MAEIKNPLELYKYLNKSNCKKCMLPSCMAFAVAVIQKQKTLEDCPELDEETRAKLSGGIVMKKNREDDQGRVLRKLKEEIAQTDLDAAAKRLNLPFRDGKIAVNCLGKDFWIDAAGDMVSECHTIPWVQNPVLQYILHSKGREPVGEWVAFGGLKGATEWNQFFSHRCEAAMRQLADAHTDLIFEILHLFGAKPLAEVTNADHSLVIHPLPRVPFLINYWMPEDDFESKLTILFDRSAEVNSNIESLYLLGRGLVEMFRALIVQHSKDGKLF